MHGINHIKKHKTKYSAGVLILILGGMVAFIKYLPYYLMIGIVCLVSCGWFYQAYKIDEIRNTPKSTEEPSNKKQGGEEVFWLDA